MAGTGTFGLMKLGTSGAEVTLPEVTAFHEDPIRQGGIHLLLNGKARKDELGTRKHFFLEWSGITEEEYATIQAAWNATEPLRFIDHIETYNVVRGNHGIKTYNEVGFISTSIELEETN